ncbi:MAG TPA: hypothetical protein VIP46_04520 [Pyrinomonadaceae bacterium]
MKDCQDLLIDESIWQAINDPATADWLARRLFVLKKTIESGPEGVKEAGETLLASIESAYLHTEAHGAALRLYVLSLTGHLKPEDEPVRLINEAINRGTARIESEGKGSAKKKRRR